MGKVCGHGDGNVLWIDRNCENGSRNKAHQEQSSWSGRVLIPCLGDPDVAN